jgi:hypothetical protein
MLLSIPAFADAIDAKAAYGDAATLVGMKLILGAVLFYILSFGLISKPKDTAVKNGRWVASTLAMMSFIGYSLQYDNQVRNLVESGIAAVVWFAIGFVIGYLWFKFKKFKTNKTNSEVTKSKKDIKALLPISNFMGISLLVLISSGITFWFVSQNYTGNLVASNGISVHTYDVFECVNGEKKCRKHIGAIKFNIDELAKEIVGQFSHDENNERQFSKLDNCVIVDKRNWQCSETFNVYIMVNDELKVKYVNAAGKVSEDETVNYVRRK